MRTTRCVNCGKPPTHDEKCPRCGNDWDIKAAPRVALRVIEAAILDAKYQGTGVVRRNGQIIKQIPEANQE